MSDMITCCIGACKSSLKRETEGLTRQNLDFFWGKHFLLPVIMQLAVKDIAKYVTAKAGKLVEKKFQGLPAPQNKCFISTTMLLFLE